MAEYRRYGPDDRFLDRQDMNRRGDDLAALTGRAGQPPQRRDFRPFWAILTDEESSGFYSGRRLQPDGKSDHSPEITYTGTLREVNDREGLEVESSSATGTRVRVVGQYPDGGSVVYLFDAGIDSLPDGTADGQILVWDANDEEWKPQAPVTVDAVTDVGVTVATQELWFKTTESTVIAKEAEGAEQVYHTGTECPAE